jgi:hypothetical protein
MQPGDIVYYKADPLLWGKLWVRGVTSDGRLECEAVHPDPDGTYPKAEFSGHEVELWDRAKTTA